MCSTINKDLLVLRQQFLQDQWQTQRLFQVDMDYQQHDKYVNHLCPFSNKVFKENKNKEFQRVKIQ